jgi:non-canonical purine NTP pyrophosphatase (RdgB/HAM1 family)
MVMARQTSSHGRDVGLITGRHAGSSSGRHAGSSSGRHAGSSSGRHAGRPLQFITLFSMKLLVATQNKGKFVEIKEVLDFIEGLELLCLSDLGIESDVEETGSSYEENSLIKAKHFFELAGVPTIGEDSGIVVEALADELGVQTRRWGAGANASDEEWIAYFLARMSGEKNRRATFTTVTTFLKGDHEPMVFKGETSGIITLTLEAEIQPGIPISACFIPDGVDKVYSALSVEEKNSLSHRGKSMQKLKEYLEKEL